MGGAVLGVASLLSGVAGSIFGERSEKKVAKSEAQKRKKLQEQEEEKRRNRLAGLQRSEGLLTSSQGVMENANVGRKTLLGE